MNKNVGNSIDKILIEAIQNTFSAFAWKSLNGEIEKHELKIKAIRKEYNEVELELVKDSTSKMADLINGKRELNIYIPESSVSFSAPLKKVVDDKKIKIIIPTEFEFFERRRHERVQPKKGFCTIELNKMNMKKPLFDLSIGGFAIVLPRTEKIIVKKGTQYSTCTIEVNSRKIKVKVECVSSIIIDRFKLDNLPYGGHKLAFRFVEIAKEDKEFLAEIITVEAILNKQLKGA